MYKLWYLRTEMSSKSYSLIIKKLFSREKGFFICVEGISQAEMLVFLFCAEAMSQKLRFLSLKGIIL